MQIRPLMLATALALLQAACTGGGGGGGGEAGQPAGPVAGADTTTGGSLFVAEAGGYAAFSLSGNRAEVFGRQQMADMQPPDVSADGREVYVIQGIRGDLVDLQRHYTYSSYKLDVASGAQSALFPPIEGIEAGGGRVSPDGHFMLIDWRRPGIDDPDSQRQVVIDRQGTVVANLPPMWVHNFSRDGRIVFITHDGSIYRTSADFRSTERVGEYPLQELPNMFDVSPDGSRIAFVNQRHVWVMNLDGSNARQLTDSITREAEPSWSPDGKSIGFIQGIFGTDLDTGTSTCREAYTISATAPLTSVPGPGARKIQPEGRTALCSFSPFFAWR